MIWFFPHVLLLNITSVIGIFLIIYTLRYRHAPGALPFTGLLFCAVIWSGGYALEITSSQFETKVFWLNIQQIGIFTSPVLWFALAMQCCSKEKWVNTKSMILISILPIISVILIWTNDLHHAMRVDVYLVEAGQLAVINSVPTILSLVMQAYGYLLLLFALILFMTTYRRAVFPFRGQLFILMISLLLPTTVKLLTVAGFNPFAPFGPTSPTFIISGLLIAWALFQYDFLQIWTIARDKIIDEIESGIIITDYLGRIVDFNPAANQLLDKYFKHNVHSGGTLIGERLDLMVLAWPEWNSVYKHNQEHRLEIKFDDNQYYEIRISRLKDKKDAFIGYLTVLHDISKTKQIESDLHKLATTDYLTGIYNRRQFMELSKQQYLLADRYNQPISLMTLDIDHFKKVNDTYGHKAGDIVLEQFASLCQSLLREADILGRIGGEEFAITLYETSTEGAYFVAEKIRSKVEKSIFRVDDQEITCTVSIGIVTNLENDDSFENLLHRADDMLYKSKETRNCISMYTPQWK